jgi:hypothetical protein
MSAVASTSRGARQRLGPLIVRLGADRREDEVVDLGRASRRYSEASHPRIFWRATGLAKNPVCATLLRPVKT